MDMYNRLSNMNQQYKINMVGNPVHVPFLIGSSWQPPGSCVHSYTQALMKSAQFFGNPPPFACTHETKNVALAPAKTI
eukprot:4520408-Amphidinium_carterae.1